MTTKFLTIMTCGLFLAGSAAMADPLPSWKDTESKAAIIAFVEKVTDPNSPDYVAPDARIATFDNDGTLWAEQPVYFQLSYALDRLREKAEIDPSVLDSDVQRAAVKGDIKGMLAGGKEGLIDILKLSHSGMTVDEFQADVREWLTTTKHPQTGKLYGDMIYKPMLELLAYLQDEEFETWIVSGGGVHFIRAFAPEVYGVPPEQVVGSVAPTKYDAERADIIKLPGVDFIDDNVGKPVGIDNNIGRRPIFAAGNSDGDFEMLEYTTRGDKPSFAMIVHHTDAEREFAYDRDSHIGKLARGLDEGPERGWLIVNMANDWEQVWP